MITNIEIDAFVVATIKETPEITNGALASRLNSTFPQGDYQVLRAV